MRKVIATYYIHEYNTKHAAMEVLTEVFGVDFSTTELYRDGDEFWTDSYRELFVTDVGTSLMRVEVLEEV